MATQEGHLGIVKVLLEHGVSIDNATTDDGTTPLFMAAQEGYLGIVMVLLEHGALIDTAVGGTTPLFIAAANGHLELVMVIKHGASINKAKTDDENNTTFYGSTRGTFGDCEGVA
jgi:ankyrin repeat protein